MQANNSIFINLSLLVLFSILAFIGVSQHEIWLDEAHHWLLARDSQTLMELWTNCRYEGHPILWNFILFLVSRFTTDVTAMQLTHVVLAIIAVYIFLFHSPFKPIEKILFILGYFILYEYTIISRNYALLILFLFLSLVFYQKEKYIPLGISLALLANTHLFGLFTASSFAVMITLEILSKKLNGAKNKMILGFIIFLIGAILSSWQIIPPPDSLLYTYGQRSSITDRIGRTGVVFLKSFIPLPDFTNYRFWNTNLLISWAKPICVLISLLLFLYPVLLFKNRISRLIYFYGGAALMLLFIFLSDHNTYRYYGIIYLLFISTVWLSRYSQPAKYLHPSTFIQKTSSKFLIGLLIIQGISGLISLTLDISRPFSESKNTATKLAQEKSADTYLAGGCGVAPVAAYLRKKIYYLNEQDYGSFCHFNQVSGQPIYDTEQTLQEAIEFVKKNQKSALLITHQPLKLFNANGEFVQLIASYDKSVLRNENYYIYKILNQ